MNLYGLDREFAYSEFKKISDYKKESTLLKVFNALKSCNIPYIVSELNVDDKYKRKYFKNISEVNIHSLKNKLENSDVFAICNIKVSGGIWIKYISKNNLPVGLKRKLIIEELTEE